MDLRSKFRWDRATPVRVAGAVLVILSMFLEAFGDMRGYRCALMTLSTLFSALFALIPHQLSIIAYAKQLQNFASAMSAIFVCASGLINPLLLLYLFTKPTWRVLVLAIFGFLLVDGAFAFAFLHTPPGIGFYIWAAGIILILAPPYKSEEQSEPPLSVTGGFEERPSRV